MSNENLKETILGFVRLIKASAMGAQVIYNAEVTDLRKGKANARSEAYNRFYDEAKGAWRVRKETVYKNVTFQRSYENSCTNRTENENATPYIAQKPNGRSWLKDAEGVILFKDTDPSIMYLRMCENKNTSRTTTYYVDGRLATEEEIAIIKAHTPIKSNVCKKQLEYGISEENQVKVKDITLNNVAFIKWGAIELKLK